MDFPNVCVCRWDLVVDFKREKDIFLSVEKALRGLLQHAKNQI